MKTRIAVIGLALFSSLALAQPEGASTGGKKPDLARMENKLGLSEDQVQQMREIRDSGGSMEDMRAVLTPEQQSQAAQIRKKHKGGKGDRRAHIQQSLNLTDEQMTEMEDIRKNGGTTQDIRAVLTPDQQAKFDTIRGERRDKASSSTATVE